MKRRVGAIAGTPGAVDRLLHKLVPVPLLVFGLNALPFALQGAPGVSDIAHLKAIALPLGNLIGWMFGGSEALLVPAPAHSTPLPLLADWLIWHLDPFGIAGLRMVHLAMAIGALALLLRAIALRMDARTAILAGVLISLSPRFIETVTNLGPDPYVFILFCWQLAILLSRGKIGGRSPLALFAGLGVASALCGVGGVLAAATLLSVLIFAAPDRAEALRRARILRVVPLWAGVLIIQLLTGAPAEPGSIRGLIGLGNKLVAHNADFLLVQGVVLLIGGTAALILLGLYCYVGRRRRNGPWENSHPFALLLLGVVTGMVLVLLAGPLLRLHDWSEPPAQAWLGLLIVLLAAACLTPRLLPASKILRRVRRLACAAMIAGAIVGSVSYHFRADWFAAGPEAGLQRALDAAGANRAIVYSGADWGRAYIPHSFIAPQDQEQWLLAFDGRSVQRVLPGGGTGEPQPLTALDGYDALLITRVDRRGWRGLTAVTNTDAIGAMPPAVLDGVASRWSADPAQAAPGEYWLTTQLLRRQRALR